MHCVGYSCPSRGRGCELQERGEGNTQTIGSLPGWTQDDDRESPIKISLLRKGAEHESMRVRNALELVQATAQESGRSRERACTPSINTAERSPPNVKSDTLRGRLRRMKDETYHG